MSFNMKIVVGAIVLLPVFAHLGYALVASPMANYYITVDQYVARSAVTPIRIGGQVVPGSIRWDNATHTLRFQISGDNPQVQVNVAYPGVAPDAFRDGVTAILDGARAKDGSFVATTLAVKCPHQYLPAG